MKRPDDLKKTALVCGTGGFIGSHLVRRLKREGLTVRAVDLKHPLYSPSPADEYIIADLRDQAVCREIMDRPYDEVYQLAADMGGCRVPVHRGARCRCHV